MEIEAKDKWISGLDNLDEFTVKSTRKFVDMFLLVSSNGETKWTRFVRFVLQKVNILVLRAFLDRFLRAQSCLIELLMFL